MMNIKEHQQVCFIRFFNQKTGSEAIPTSKVEGSVNKKLAEELYKPVIKKFSRRRVYARFTDNIRAADLAQIESLSSKNKDIRFLLYVINHFTYVWVKPLKDKKNKTAFNAFMKIVNECNHKPKKLWVDQGEKFRNKLIQE